MTILPFPQAVIKDFLHSQGSLQIKRAQTAAPLFLLGQGFLWNLTHAFLLWLEEFAGR